jgi:hypothetical protein
LPAAVKDKTVNIDFAVDSAMSPIPNLLKTGSVFEDGFFLFSGNPQKASAPSTTNYEFLERPVLKWARRR